ncbi:MAG: glycoside hydrolase family 13 protein [Halanaerobiales bacterium]
MPRLQIVHDSFEEFYRSPFGAAVVGDKITIRLKVCSSQRPEKVILHIEDDLSSEETTTIMNELSSDEKEQISDELSNGENNRGDSTEESGEVFTYEQRDQENDRLNCEYIYQAQINTGETPGLKFYYFQIDINGEKKYYCKSKDGTGGEGRVTEEPENKYQITVYSNDMNRPLWFPDSIVYQIFVDRFFNGNPDNEVLNPKRNCLIQSHWNNDPLYIKNEEGHVIRWDFFGGNLIGVRKKLAYLKKLGISTIYFNPIFKAVSNHKYDTGDYHQIDEMFGNNQIFAELVQEAEEIGISIILDGVFSHTGSDSIYFNRYGNYESTGAYQSKDSPYYSWYRFNEHPDDYESWWGVSDLPNVNELEKSYQDFIIYNEDSVLNFWLDMGIKGWRLDVVDELPPQFLKNFKRQMRSKNNESILIGEVWEDASNKSSYDRRREYFLGKELDSATNYPFRKTLIEFISGQIDSEFVHKRLMTLAENYPKYNFYSALNLLGTHDVPRILTELGRDLKEKSLAVKRLKLLSLWQMTFPGVPCIYYGDEVGLEGESDPDNRRTYPWGNENQELLDWYHQIIKLRNNYDIFKTGKWRSFYLNNDVYGYIRSITHQKDVFGQERQNNTALIIFNRSINESHEVYINFKDWFKGSEYVQEYFLDEKINTGSGSKKIEIKPLTAKVYIDKV